jgi:hypothetical protein
MKANKSIFKNISPSELRSASKALRLMLLLLEAEHQSQSWLWKLFFGFKNTRKIINELIIAFDSFADLLSEQKTDEDNKVN